MSPSIAESESPTARPPTRNRAQPGQRRPVGTTDYTGQGHVSQSFACVRTEHKTQYQTCQHMLTGNDIEMFDLMFFRGFRLGQFCLIRRFRQTVPALVRRVVCSIIRVDGLIVTFGLSPALRFRLDLGLSRPWPRGGKGGEAW